MIWSDWHNVQRDGTIPASILPCDYFQLRYFVQWDYDILDPLRMFQQLTGKWRWNIAGPDLLKVFDQQNQVRVTINWLSMAGSLSMVSWYWDSSGDKIETFLPSPAETLGNMAETLYLDPASNPTADFADPTVYIQSYYYGPIYRLNLGEGSKIALPFHNVGATWLIKLANIGIRTARSGAGDAYWDRPGFVRAAVPSGGYLLQQFSGDSGASWNVRRVTPALSDPRLFKDATNALYCAGWKAKEYLALTSPNDGRTWSRWRDMLIWDAGYSDVDTTLAGGATIVSVARRGGAIWFRSAGDNFSTTTRIGNCSKPMMLTVDPRTQSLLVTDGQSLTYRSLDGGRSWQQVAGV